MTIAGYENPSRRSVLIAFCPRPDAVRCTSDSKGYLRQQVDQAREEVRNLEQRWLAASAADAGMPIVRRFAALAFRTLLRSLDL